MDLPQWLPWVVAGVAIIAWRRVVQGWMRAGRFSPRGAAAVYAAVIPVLVLIAFVLWGRFSVVALVYAAVGFALSYGIALLSFRRMAMLDRGGG